MVRDSRNYSGANNATVLTILCTQYTGSTQEYVFSSPLREQAMCDCEAQQCRAIIPDTVQRSARLRAARTRQYPNIARLRK